MKLVARGPETSHGGHTHTGLARRGSHDMSRDDAGREFDTSALCQCHLCDATCIWQGYIMRVIIAMGSKPSVEIIQILVQSQHFRGS